MGDSSPNDDWLHGNIIACPNCQQRLYRVDHSPMLVNYSLYCDRCANSVEIGFYDPVYSAIYNSMSDKKLIDYRELMITLEQKLKPCTCGGHFKHDAARRCYNCLAIVIQDVSDIDLYPEIYALNVDERDPTPEECELVGNFEATHIRREDIWID